MSNALLEAMATGVPSIATTVGAAGEMINNSESGILFTPGDRIAMRAALRRLVDDPALRPSMGEAGRSSISRRYGIDSVVSRIEAAYRSAMTAT
ncbi:MAG: glycosyltransferase, partial [Chloroflexi bacterium]